MSETQAPRADDVSPDPVVTPASLPPAPPPASVRRKGSGKASGLVLLALLVAAGGLGVGGWSVWQLQQVRQAEQSQAAQAEDLRSQLRQLEMRNQALSADLGRLPSANELEERRRQLGELQGDQQHLAEQFKEVVGQSRQAWRLTEAEHLLRMATLRMTALQDVPSAQNLLQGVDDILKAQNDPAAFAARQQLANAQQTLRQLPDLDRTGQFVQLASLRNQVQSLEPLPPRFSTTVADQPGVEKAAVPPSNALQQWWQDFRQRISSYFRIDFSADQPIRPLLAEESLAQVRLAMSLALEQAQWAVLNGNQEVYRLSIEQAEDVLAAHFNNQNPDSRAVKLRLQELAERPVTFEAPDLTPALTALQAYIAQRQQIQPNNAAAGAAQENRP
ncbi:uroporphyrinogen-III C-methyltransferase [Pseudomonas oryzihabitans]|uniref:uroporphyrinogen-III C-methyltransferase n=1 Tax=Pseudomonas oryzihabitans TaxID=47885 RepID=UPI003CF9DEFD